MVEVRRGLYLPGPDLWLDPGRRVGRAFVSHAHSDHAGIHGWTLCTPCTGRLMAARRSGGREFLLAEFGSRVDLGGGWLAELLPAGHVTGSAQLYLEGPEGSLLYTGDFKRRPSPSCEPYEPRRAETLITECTFGLPRYVFPDPGEVGCGIVGFCVSALRDGGVPVLLAYSLGKAQELACLLAGAGLPVVAHRAVVGMTRICAEFVSGIPVPEEFDPADCGGRVVLVPPSAAGSRAVRGMNGARFAVVTGWALDPGAVFRYQCDAAFALSDHAGYGELIETVAETAPARVYAVHGPVKKFAADLRRRGYDAHAPGHDEQLDFEALLGGW